MVFFKFNSSEVYQFYYDYMCYESLAIEEPVLVANDIRATELPDSSFLITGGYAKGKFQKTTLHFYSNHYYKKNKMSVSRSNHCSIYHKGFVYCFGGLNNDGALDHCEAFDMNSDEWVPMPPMISGRFNAGCCKFGEGKAYIFGGTQ
jgi:hypothetical protein